MHLFMVVADDLLDDVKRHYPDTHYVIAPNAYVVADAESLSASVSQTLGITAIDDKGQMVGRKRGVVVAIDNYFGIFNAALWQRMSAWADE